MRLGAELIAAITRGLPREEGRRWLESLGQAAARAAASSTSSSLRVDPLLLDVLVRRVDELAREQPRSRLCDLLGRELLATLYRGLPEALRQEAATVSRSNICKKLDQARPLPLPRADDRELLGALVEQVLTARPARAAEV
jgi:hypothetical protein